MPRKKIEVSKTELAAVIGNVEHDNTFTTRNDLAAAVAQQMSIDISPSVVLLRIKEFGLEPKTPVGKRGRRAGVKLSDEHKAKMQAGRKQKKSFDVSDVRKAHPASDEKLLDRVAEGSYAASVKAKCRECAGFVTSEITNCTITSCALYHLRPYQK